MKYFNGVKSKNYFEGWYFRHEFSYGGVSFIPSIATNDKGAKSCYIQVITQTESHIFEFDFSLFFADKDLLYIKIGQNIFSENGCEVSLQNDVFSINAKLKYSQFAKLKGDIMGIFAAVPFMECRHGVISMRHIVSGTLALNGLEQNIDDGVGYIEKDSGTSFPKQYLWLQCNNFNTPQARQNSDLAVFVSIATIPFLGGKFKGHIASVIYNGKEYRFATYNGSKLIKSFIYDSKSEPTIKLRRGKSELTLSFVENDFCSLSAPTVGKMDREVKESLNARVSASLTIDGVLVFSEISSVAALEYSI